MTELHLAAKWTMPFLARYFNILLVMRSHPGAFLGEILQYVLGFLWCKEFDLLRYL
jgi:hypothetical protein